MLKLYGFAKVNAGARKLGLQSHAEAAPAGGEDGRQPRGCHFHSHDMYNRCLVAPISCRCRQGVLRSSHRLTYRRATLAQTVTCG